MPLAAGDTITVTFEADTDQSGSGDKAFVDALLQARTLAPARNSAAPFS